jgi:imidazolonepropionase-like amidohydrolase
MLPLLTGKQLTFRGGFQMKNYFRFVVIIVALVAGICGCTHYSLIEQSPPAADGYLIKNVDVFTAVSGRELLRNMDVYIQKGTIAKVSPERLDIPGAEVIEGQGKMLLPGLTDFHTHITSGMVIPWARLTPTTRFNLEACLYSGVTAIVDMSGESSENMETLAGDIETGKIAGPHLFQCGMGFTGKGSHPIPMTEKIKENYPWFVHPFFPKVINEVESISDMKSLDEHLAAKPDFTKIFLDDLPDGTPKMAPEIVSAIVKRSHQKGIPVIIHIGRNEDVKVAIDSGADAIAHDVYKEPLDPGLARELAAKKMLVTPTVYVFHNLNLFMNERNFTHYTRLEWETMYPACAKELQNPKPYVIPEGDPWGNYFKHFKQTYDQVLHPNVKVLKDAGVTIIAGTDSPNLGIAPGGSLHVELAHLVQGGLTPTEALISATSTPARILREVFHREVNFGTIEKGKAADLLLVQGDPTKNIQDTENIVDVFYRGNRLLRHK